MSSVKFYKSKTGEVNTIDIFDLLVDPIRSKIIFEILVAGQITADEIVELTGKSRSTISHHLKKLVMGELLEVYMNPTGKTKYYRINREISKLRYEIDKKTLLESPIEDSSKFILDNTRVAAVLSQVFSNVFADNVKYLQDNQPFDKVLTDKFEQVIYEINNERGMMPTSLSLLIDEEAAVFVEKKLDELFKELNEKFGPYPEKLLEKQMKPLYILNANIFPHFKGEKKEKEKN